eukprot:CAMPEP_0195526866 /NCGR_PEP_ID=MMETSP0794_2-20130614/28173_1 /TAXON_ID=515487 /ORGANISM="Stephanopyxis turris, Strain CCMP 815" /LENGTH=216 /DNA_ID=CAMNT_0040657651 /DNA_START=229 /DNA_END=879 /DNA_ORIENTATION=-
MDFAVRSAGLSAPALLRASPTYNGVVMKLHVPLFFTIIPTFVQRAVTSTHWCSCLAPSWKQRTLIVVGKYVYRFKDESADSPKGSPLSLDCLDSHLVGLRDDIGGLELAFQHLPEEYKAIFSVVTFSKTYYFAVTSHEEAVTWVNSLREAKQEAITRSMGHSRVPVPKDWDYFDSLAKKFAESKESIKTKMAAHRGREMEMSTFQDGSPASRGVYG